jgi:type I restriction enzyme, S subunit
MLRRPQDCHPAPLADICVKTPRRDPRAAGNGTFRYVDIEAVDNQRLQITAPKTLNRLAAPSRARHEIRAGDVLFSLVRPYLKNIARVPPDLDGEIASSAFHVLRPSPAVLTDYLFYAVQREAFIRSVVTYGESPPAARDDEFEQLTIPLVPLDRQAQVVAAIEQQLTRIDVAQRALADSRRRIERLRASILAGAWRRARAESGEETLADLSQASDYGTSQKSTYEAEGPPILRIPNVAKGRLILADMKFATRGHELIHSKALNPGDFLIVRTNGSRNLIGRGAVVETAFETPHFHASYLIRFRLLGDADLWRWVSLLWSAPQIRSTLEAMAATSAGQYNLNLRILGGVRLPVPERGTLASAVSALEERLTVVDEMEQEVERSAQRGAALGRSILDEAFACGPQ